MRLYNTEYLIDDRVHGLPCFSILCELAIGALEDRTERVERRIVEYLVPEDSVDVRSVRSWNAGCGEHRCDLLDPATVNRTVRLTNPDIVGDGRDFCLSRRVLLYSKNDPRQECALFANNV